MDSWKSRGSRNRSINWKRWG